MEVMVGMVIGMLAVIVMMQVFSVSEERKRNATSGSDAQSTGIISFYQMQKDIMQAGYGFTSRDLFDCKLNWKVASGSMLHTPVRLAPVTINPPADDPNNPVIPAGDDNTDTLLVIHGNGSNEPQGIVVSSQPDGNAKNVVLTPSVFSENDRVISLPRPDCGLGLFIDKVISKVDNNVFLEAGTADTLALFNLGSSPTIVAYAIRHGKLTQCNYLVNDCGIIANKDNPEIWTPVANDIVSMKAVYRRDTTLSPDGIPDEVVHSQPTPSSPCDWVRTPAISLVLVARSGQYSRDVINAPVPTWPENNVASIAGVNGPIGLNLANDEPWRHYRYRVFDAVIPMRNVSWMDTKPCV